MTKFRALVDLVVAGKGVKAGSTFDTSDEQAAPAVAFGLAEAVKGGKSTTVDSPSQPKAKRSSGKAR